MARDEFVEGLPIRHGPSCEPSIFEIPSFTHPVILNYSSLAGDLSNFSPWASESWNCLTLALREDIILP